MGPCTTPNKIVQWSKLWTKVRAANSRILKTSAAPDGYDFEKGLIKKEGETDAAFAERVREHNEAFEVWSREDIVLGLNDKQRDTARDAMKWVVSHQKEARTKLGITEGIGCLLLALGIVDQDEDEESESASAAG
jgi:hypothetical protein